VRDCAATLREVASLAPGSIFAMSFLLPLQLADAETRAGLELAVKGARARHEKARRVAGRFVSAG